MGECARHLPLPLHVLSVHPDWMHTQSRMNTRWRSCAALLPDGRRLPPESLDAWGQFRKGGPGPFSLYSTGCGG